MKNFAHLLVMHLRSQGRRPTLYLLLLPPLVVLFSGNFLEGITQSGFGLVAIGHNETAWPPAASLTVAFSFFGLLWLPVNLATAKLQGMLARFRASPVARSQYYAAEAAAHGLLLLAGIGVLAGGVALGQAVPWLGQWGVSPAVAPVTVAAAAPAAAGMAAAAAICLAVLMTLATGYLVGSLLAPLGVKSALTGGSLLLVGLLVPTGAIIPASLLPVGLSQLAPYSPFYYILVLLNSWPSPNFWSAQAFPLGLLTSLTVVGGLAAAKLLPWE